MLTGEQVIQIAFAVPDLGAAMDWWTDEAGIGPWFVLDRIGGGSTYRGQPADAEFTIAVAVSGSMMIELVQTLDDKPSIYKEARARHGYGFHHVGKFRPNVKQLAEDYEAKGRSIIFQSLAPGAATSSSSMARRARLASSNLSKTMKGQESCPWRCSVHRPAGKANARSAVSRKLLS